MQIICISDTHLHHPDMSLYEGDMIIHCGDATNRGYLPELISFINWYSSLNQFKYKILIPGNHDFIFENDWRLANNLCKDVGIICLNDSGIEIKGIKIWGSPITPWFNSWAFNRLRGEQIQKHWDLIPNDVNILITHGPPSDVGELSLVFEKERKLINGKWAEGIKSEDVGCKDLRKKVDEIKPKYHLFGHIHEGYGVFKNQHTTFINCTHFKNNSPIEFYYDSLACNNS